MYQGHISVLEKFTFSFRLILCVSYRRTLPELDDNDGNFYLLLPVAGSLSPSKILAPFRPLS